MNDLHALINEYRQNVFVNKNYSKDIHLSPNRYITVSFGKTLSGKSLKADIILYNSHTKEMIETKMKSCLIADVDQLEHWINATIDNLKMSVK